MFRHERQKKPVRRAVESVLELFEKKRGAVSAFAGPISFTAGGPNLSRPTIH